MPHVDYRGALKRNEKKEQDSNKDINFSCKDEGIQFTYPQFHNVGTYGIASSSRVKSPYDCTALMRHSFTNSPSVNDFECLTITWNMVYDAIMTYVEDVAASELELQSSW